MLSEVESAHSKKWEVGSAELKANGPGFIRASSALGECRIKSKWAGIYQGKLSFRATKCPKAGLRGRGQSPHPSTHPGRYAT